MFLYFSAQLGENTPCGTWTLGFNPSLDTLGWDLNPHAELNKWDWNKREKTILGWIDWNKDNIPLIFFPNPLVLLISQMNWFVEDYFTNSQIGHSKLMKGKAMRTSFFLVRNTLHIRRAPITRHLWISACNHQSSLTPLVEAQNWSWLPFFSYEGTQ